MRKPAFLLLLALSVTALVAACNGGDEETPTAEPTTPVVGSPTAASTGTPVTTPVVTGTPDATGTPQTTPVATGTPDATGTPQTTPVATGTPDATGTPQTTPVATGTPDATGTPGPTSGTIGEVLAGIESASTFVAAIETLELGDILTQDGDYTFFVPSNAALEQMDEAERNALLGDAAALEEVLSHSLVAGAFRQDDFPFEPLVDAEDGSILQLTQTETGAFAVEGRVVIEGDIEASNGYIHVIDGVLTLPEPE